MFDLQSGHCRTEASYVIQERNAPALLLKYMPHMLYTQSRAWGSVSFPVTLWAAVLAAF